MTDNQPSVAVIGAGRMGAAMVHTLRLAGFSVEVWNRSSDKSRAVADATGATTARTPAEAAAGVGVIISSLADDAAVEDVYLGSGHLASGVGPGQVVIEMSTVHPETQRTVGGAVEASGAGFLDAPVSGSVSTAEAGALTIMAAGSKEALDAARPVLDTLATTVVHVGARGAGAATKLAVNALVHGLNMVLAEALVLAERAGVERSIVYDVFASGAGGAPFVLYKREAFEQPEQAAVAFSLDLVAKDYELIAQLADEVGAPMRQASVGLEIVNDAIGAGMGEQDMSAVAVYLRKDKP